MESHTWTIIFPDFQGKASLNTESNSFVARLRAATPDATLVSILNGLPIKELNELSEQVISTTTLLPVISRDERGLLGTLISGYQYALDIATGPIIRLDTAEHPPEKILELVEVALRNNSMVIGDLDFSTGGLREESIDEFAHLDLFPTLYSQTTKDKLSISCAHGFQVFPNKIQCDAAFLNTLEIVNEVEHELEQPVIWGFDGAIALGAVAANINVKVMNVAAKTVRDRPRQKVAKQFNGALHMCRAAAKLYKY
jgi:hypothetical protein